MHPFFKSCFFHQELFFHFLTHIFNFFWADLHLGTAKDQTIQSYAYPHCRDCSGQQGSILSHLSRKINSGELTPNDLPNVKNVHGGTRTYALRTFYFILPWCFIINFLSKSSVAADFYEENEHYFSFWKQIVREYRSKF